MLHKKLRTLIALCSAIALAVTGGIAISAAEAVSVSYSASEEGVLPGDSLEVSVELPMETNIKSIMITPEFDSSVLTLVSMNWQLTGATITESSSSPAIAAFSADTPVSGRVFTCVFKASEGNSETKTEIAFDVRIKSKSGAVESELTCESPEKLAVSIETGAYILGDANGDGNLNSLDLVRLMRRIAGEDIPVFSGDLNGDGKFGAVDLTRLMHILAEDNKA